MVSEYIEKILHKVFNQKRFVVILNNKSGVSKGKMCRVCLHLGLSQECDVVPFKAVILKGGDDFDKLYIENQNRIESMHRDAGFTQCDPFTILGFSLYCDQDEFKDLKLY